MSRSGEAAASVSAEPEVAEPERRQRADARRNHDLLLAAAAEVYAERGTEASLEEIARRAGVGIGTLYRHFPTRDALSEAVYRRGVEQLCDGAARRLAHDAADVALGLWMRDFAAYVATKKGMAAALKSVLGSDSELFTYSHRRIREALGALVDAAVASGSIRDDVDAADLLRALSGICMSSDPSDPPGRTERLVGLLMDGLRYRPPTTSS